MARRWGPSSVNLQRRIFSGRDWGGGRVGGGGGNGPTERKRETGRFTGLWRDYLDYGNDSVDGGIVPNMEGLAGKWTGVSVIQRSSINKEFVRYMKIKIDQGFVFGIRRQKLKIVRYTKVKIEGDLSGTRRFITHINI